MIELKLSLCQRFQCLKNYVNTKLRGILTVHPGKTEHVANKIDSLASYIKDNRSYDGSDAVAQPALVAMIANNGHDVDAYAEPAITTAHNFLTIVNRTVTVLLRTSQSS